MKKLFKIILLISIFSITFYGFATSPAKAQLIRVKKEKSMLEKRDVQTHYYNTASKAKVMKALAHSIQDNGFIIQKTDYNLGFIKAKKEIKAKRTDKGFVALQAWHLCSEINRIKRTPYWPFAYSNALHHANTIKREIDPHTVVYNLNASVDTVGTKTKVRLTVIEEEKSNNPNGKDSTRKVLKYFDKGIYGNIFAQIDKNFALEK